MAAYRPEGLWKNEQDQKITMKILNNLRLDVGYGAQSLYAAMLALDIGNEPRKEQKMLWYTMNCNFCSQIPTCYLARQLAE